MSLLNTIICLSIIIPILFWIYRFRDIEKIYHVFAIYLISGFITEVIHAIAYEEKYVSVMTSIIFHVFESQCILFLFSFWIDLKIYFRKLFQLLFFIISSIESVFIYNTLNRNIFPLYILLVVVLIIFGIKILTSQNYKITISQKLIIFPTIVYFIYYSVLDILMSLLFNKHNQPVFINLYNIISLINFLSYISYSLAFLWAPKKEKYL